jgi:hypothetical protein
VRNVLNRVVPLALAATLVLVASGCSSCEQSAPAPSPAAKKGRLPRPPGAAGTSASTPEPPRCAVVAGASVEEGAAPLQVGFVSEGSCSETKGTFTWDFGDGSAVSHEQNPMHTYFTPGTYTARVTLEDPENKVTDSDEVPITVTPQLP